MRKAILILLLFIMCVCFFSIMCFGFKIGNLKVNSYSEIETANIEKKVLLSQLNEKNVTEFNNKKAALNKAIQVYQSKKSEYDKLVSEGKITNTSIYNSIDLYDIDFLWTTIGNYATEKGVTLQFDVIKSATSTSISSEYVMCDLNFTVTGEYIAITDFIYSLEDDDKLNFELSNFLLEKGGENLQATFVVKDIPINSKNLSTVPTSGATNYDGSSNSTISSN